MLAIVTAVEDYATGLAPFAAFFAMLAVITKRGAIVPAWQRCRRETVTNVGLAMIFLVSMAPLVVLSEQGIAAIGARNPIFVHAWEAAPVFVGLSLCFLIVETVAYWMHRAFHVRELWRFHATHHADEALTWYSVTRKHPVEKITDLVYDTAPVYLLGAPLWYIGLVQFLRTCWGYLIHADVPWTFGPLRHVLISPAAHRLHHARDESLMGSNFANTFAFIDVLFGTFQDPTPHVGCATGIAEGTRGIFGELARPWERTYRKPQDHVGDEALTSRSPGASLWNGEQPASQKSALPPISAA